MCPQFVCVCVGVACQEDPPRPPKIHGYQCFSTEAYFAPRGHVTMSGDAFFFFFFFAADGLLLACSGWRPGVLPNLSRCTGHPKQRLVEPRMSEC